MKPVTTPPSKFSPSKLLCLLFLLCAWPHQALAQSAQTQPDASSQLRPLGLPQLYAAFLSYQNHLDTLAAQREAKGQDASWIRDDLQNKLGFSDADYAPIRTSSQRLTSEIAVLSQQVKQIRSSAPSTSGSGQAQALTALTKQRQADVESEIYNLAQALSPQNKAALEKFMAQFFAPKKIAFRAPASTGSAVQK